MQFAETVLTRGRPVPSAAIAAVTNEIRREKRALLDQLELTRETEAGLAKREERRRRNRERARLRRLSG